MAAGWWHWLWLTGGGLAVRIAAGGSLLAGFLIVDLLRCGRQSRRLREYAFLLVGLAGAMAYGLANDMVTVTISPEYFIAHEKLTDDTVNVRAVAAVVGLKATWSIGLVLAAALLFANSVRRGWPPLPFRRLYARLLYVAVAAAGAAALGGAAAYSRLFDPWLGISGSSGVRAVMCVYCAHTGAYAGGAIAGVWSVVSVVLGRRKLAHHPLE